MRAGLVLLLLVTACVAGPRPKAPDESHRTPVNRTVPPELRGDGESEEQARRTLEPKRVWR